MMMMASLMVVPVAMMAVVEARNYTHVWDKVMMVMSPVMMVLHLHHLIFCRNRRG